MLEVEKVSHETKKAFTASYDAHADALFRHIHFRVSDRELAKDLLQNTFLRAWEYLSAGEQVTNMKAFLYKVANNMIIDEYRKKKNQSLDAMLEQGFDPADSGEEIVTLGAEASLLKKALARIPTEYREVAVMRHIDGFSPAEIATILGESPNAISVRIHRSIEMLKKELGV